MINKFIILVLICLPLSAFSQHTFSIVAVDSITGEIGSAGATCGDSIIWPGSSGAKIISDVIPGVGAIHTQSYYNITNQINAHNHMVANENPQQIIDWLVQNDVAGDPTIRQYGVIDYNSGHPRTAAYTGSSCMNYKNHITGPNYSIQGNILLGQQILDSMERKFLNTASDLADKLMAALQGAKVVGADTRCTSEGTSSLSAFIRVARPNDQPNGFHLDINIAGTPPGVEPIDNLQNAYDIWKLTSGIADDGSKYPNIEIFPNPTDGRITLKFHKKIPDEIEIINLLGETVLTQKTYGKDNISIDLSKYHDGLYFLNSYKENTKLVKKIWLKK